MLRFLFLLFLIFTFISQVQADSWDDFSNIDRMWDGQKSITNKEFDQVVDALEERTQNQSSPQPRQSKHSWNKPVSSIFLHQSPAPC